MATDRLAGMLFNQFRENIKYQYRVIVTPNIDDVSEETLNEFSDNGWELVTVINTSKIEEIKYKMIFRKLQVFQNPDQST